MLKLLKLFFFLIVLISCKKSVQKKETKTAISNSFTEVVTNDYELYKPNKTIKAVLFLFGGYPETASAIKREFKILELAKVNKIAVVLLNYNKRLWLEKEEKYELAKQLQTIIELNKLPSENIFIGGFSSGGVMSLLISDFIIGMKQFYIDPKGVFIVDSPIDLQALYASSIKNLQRKFSEPAVLESTWIIDNLTKALGSPEEHIENYQNKSVFTYSTGIIKNVKHLKNTKIRLYTEPDTLWWKKHRMADYDQMNAFYIKELYKNLKAKGFKQITYIPTTNKGYRANGEKHPHSWSIVDKEDLVKWMLEE